MLTVICVFVIAATYVCWRLWHVANAKNEILPLLPPENRLSWRVSASRSAVPHGTMTDGPNDNTDFTFAQTPSGHFGQDAKRIPDFDIFSWGVATDGLLQALPEVVAFSHVDPEVLKAIEFSTAEHVYGLASVDNYINDHFFSRADSSAEGWLHRLEGYVGEQKAAAVLEQAGHHVEFPDAPNHPDVDFYVDGAPWQIKEGSSAAAQVKEFLLQHDGIEIGTSPDVAAALNDSHVHGIPELDHDTIAEATKDSLHGVKDGFHSGFHFPIVTFGFSSYRETKLLWNEKTTIEKALKNVAVDVAGVGAGAFAGAKAGALAGATLGPHGAAVGALIGSIAGAIGGKKVATAVRFSAFNKAKADYVKTVESAQEAITLRIEQSRLEVRQLQQAHQTRYEQDCALIVRRTQSEVSSLQKSCEVRLQMLAEVFPSRLDALADQLQKECAEILALIPSSLLAFAFPRRSDVLRSMIKQWFARAAQKVAYEKQHYLAMEDRSRESLVFEIRRFLSAYEFELDSLEKDIRSVVESFETSKIEAERVQQKAITDAKALRTGLLHEFGERVGALDAEIGNVILRWKQDIENYRSILRREATPLGIEI